MAENIGDYQEQPTGLQRQLKKIKQSVAELSGCLTDIDKNKKRWLVTGVVLNSVLTPTLRKYVTENLEQIYQTLKRNNNIDTQLYPHQLASYLTTYLNYEAINGNKAWGLRQQSRFNYKVKDAVDFSKLFLKTHMAHFSAFDDSCDSFALLEIMIGSCPVSSQVRAKKVKDEVRNPWAHCDFRDWDDNMYKKSITLIKDLIESLGLHNQEEIITLMQKWNQNGEQFINGTSPETVALREIQTEVQNLLCFLETVHCYTPDQIIRLKVELADANLALSEFVKKVQDLETANQEMTICIEGLEKRFAEKEKCIPKHLKEIFQIYIAEWEKEEDTFTVTRATEHVTGLIKENNVVVVVGSSGSGKSSLIHHVALKLKTEFNIIPFVSSPADIIHYRDIKENQLFVIDDLCGKNYINETELQAWERQMETIKKVFPQNQNGYGRLKILVSCRLQVFKEDKFKNLKIFTQQTVNLQSKENCLLPHEKLKMIRKYTVILETDWQQISKGLEDCQYFPLLCKMSKDKPVGQLTKLFRSPISSIKKDIKDMIKSNSIENCALVLCVLFPDGFHRDFIDPRKRPHSVQQKVTDITDTYEINLANERKRVQILETFKRLDGTYIKKIGSVYSISHDKLYNMVAVVCCHQATELYLKYAPSTLIAKQFRLKSVFPVEENQLEQLHVYLNEEEETRYFDRLFQDLKQKSFKPVFRNTQLQNEGYQRKLMAYIEKHKNSCDQLFHLFDEEGMTEVFEHDQKDNTRLLWLSVNTTPVVEATKTGFYMLVEYLIHINCDINKKDSTHHTPLYYSCENGFVNIFHLLITHGGNINDAVVYACNFGMTNEVRMFLESGVDLSQCRSSCFFKWTPLVAACDGGHREIVEALIDKGADLAQVDWFGATPLAATCKNGHKELAEMLLEKGADLSQCSVGIGGNPLVSACASGHREIVEMLLKRGADPAQCSDIANGTALNAACKHGHKEIAEMLIEKGADLSQCSEWIGEIPLVSACTSGHIEIVEMLLKRGADLTACDYLDNTPLIAACESGHREIVEMLIKNGADVSHRASFFGWTPLTAACNGGHKKIAERLIECGADIFQFGNGKNPLTVACSEGQTEIVKMLLDKGAYLSQCRVNGSTPLIAACSSGHKEIVKMLIGRGADLSSYDYKYDLTPLTAACKHGHKEIVEMLIENGADLTECCRGRLGWTPLIAACNGSHRDIVEMLIKRGADPAQRDRRGLTALNLASDANIMYVLKTNLKQ